MLYFLWFGRIEPLTVKINVRVCASYMANPVWININELAFAVRFFLALVKESFSALEHVTSPAHT
jgi:hypothetical protein